MQFIPLFVKTDTTHLPAAMVHSGASAPAPFRLRPHLFP